MVDDEEDQVIIFKVLLFGSLAHLPFSPARKHTVEFCPNPSPDLFTRNKRNRR
jgi:hypothetical protein